MVSFSPECKGEDRVIQATGDVITTEGETVTLGCTFETTRASPNLLWYKQENLPSTSLLSSAKPKHVDENNKSLSGQTRRWSCMFV
uniref:Ig-like domain-containing protein n=1 Tax=Sander lucioperca TaxID=283035 RepID=A0A8C9ZNX7_SANLU